MNPQNPTPPQKKGRFQFKPWPLQDFLISLAAVMILFVIETFLPKGMLSSSSLIAGSMAGMTMSYLSFCGYSVIYSPFRTKLALGMIFVGVMVVSGGLAEILLGKH